MKTFAVAVFCLLSTAAFSADPPPKDAAKPLSCGKTAEECQKSVDDLANRLAQMTLSFQAERQQRINNQTALGDQATQAFVAQQVAGPKK